MGIPQDIYQVCFVIMCKCLEIDLKNCRNIVGSFRSDKKGIHPVLLVAKVDKEVSGNTLHVPIILFSDERGFSED